MANVERYALVLADQAHAEALAKVLPLPQVRVPGRKEFLSATIRKPPTVAFVDRDLLSVVEGDTSNVPIIGVVAGSLVESIGALDANPWLAHVVTTGSLATPFARSHLELVLDRFANGPEHDPLGLAPGRTALLSSSNRRQARFERMREYYAMHRFSERAIASITDVAEELVTNALYDAPVEAGYFGQAVPRTEPVELPPEHACEISYGIEGTTALVRVRDPFGAFTRARMMGVLERCKASGVSLDESRGGAGLGLWRVFSTASAVAITVIPGRLTDMFVRIESKRSRSLAIHLFFPDDHVLDGAHGRLAADHDYDLMDESFTRVA